MVQRLVHALHDAPEVALVLGGVGAGGQAPLGGGHGQHLRVGHEGLQVRAHLLDRVVDEGLLAREPLEFGLEVAAPELGDAGHRLLLHGDVAGHHVVHALGHGAVDALEALGVDRHVDVAQVVLVAHLVHVGHQAVQGADAEVQVVLDLVEVALVGLGDQRRDVALRDPVDVARGHVERVDDGIQHLVDADEDPALIAADPGQVCPLVQAPGLDGLGQELDTLQDGRPDLAARDFVVGCRLFFHGILLL